MLSAIGGLVVIGILVTLYAHHKHMSAVKEVEDLLASVRNRLDGKPSTSAGGATTPAPKQ